MIELMASDFQDFALFVLNIFFLIFKFESICTFCCLIVSSH